MPWDTLIKNALLFDGRADAPVQQDVAIQDGKIAAVGPDLDAAQATEVVDANGRWLMPGLWDIHTHLDLEVQLAIPCRTGLDFDVEDSGTNGGRGGEALLGPGLSRKYNCD
jgi:N-acyl-D-aspartate/D-glutamate deacylase